jgi:heat shock protein HslJ
MRGRGWLLLAGLLAACAGRAPETAARPVTAQNLIGSEWRAEEIAGSGVADQSHSTLRFAAAGLIDGLTGCNRFMGPVTIDGQAIHIGPLGSTRRACAAPLMDQERRYLVALASAAGFRLDGSQLLLLDANQQTLVRYTRVDSHAIPTRP